MSNKNLKNLMIQEYGNFCWLGGIVTVKNPLTYHHVKKKKGAKGENTIDNGALLSRKMHKRFNSLEGSLAFEEINQMFEHYIRTRDSFFLEEAKAIYDEYIDKFGHQIKKVYKYSNR